ncbi:hypothetical protein AXG93_215s1160 [Marchantia polymorpha subsp. ruderalis]|uniref:Uncharacterized protein n=1 Tax=Marchantia polymorpha subsp. ruderalis TaxID=1480154 RepID=A0A176W170_MARPO|nr:hypothetical protein AXG93_215s1160 [Marchantia polymorpha subsp. ruderalis]
MSRRPFRMSDTGILLMRSVREPPQCGDLRTSFTGPTTSFILDCFPPTSPKETRVRSTASCTRSSKACDGRLRALRGGGSSSPGRLLACFIAAMALALAARCPFCMQFKLLRQSSLRAAASFDLWPLPIASGDGLGHCSIHCSASSADAVS